MAAVSVARSLAVVVALSMGPTGGAVLAPSEARAEMVGEQQQGISTEDVLEAQKAWGKGIVQIGRVFAKGGDLQAAARDHVTSLYAYDLGPVLFKPTLASKTPFRSTVEEAMSYFVGGVCEEDNGFALRPWTFVRVVNEGIIVDGNRAMAMGQYYFTDADGAITKAEYSFCYIRDDSGRLRITLHHSSLPYVPEV